jgi:hypothetical protein
MIFLCKLFIFYWKEREAFHRFKLFGRPFKFFFSHWMFILSFLYWCFINNNNMNYSKGVYNMGYLLPNTWHLRIVSTMIAFLPRFVSVCSISVRQSIVFYYVVSKTWVKLTFMSPDIHTYLILPALLIN